MTKEEIKSRASNLYTYNYRGVECVSKVCAETFAEHISELTKNEIKNWLQENLHKIVSCKQGQMGSFFTKIDFKHLFKAMEEDGTED